VIFAWRIDFKSIHISVCQHHCQELRDIEEEVGMATQLLYGMAAQHSVFVHVRES